ncbi:MAG TPA: hypothetical protein DD661_06785 [Gammaproteobacteria bacterium]|jgi:hypothetical protein|nr:hypothetical protein [Gammaproteobacteria bacterium]|tara:strand:+ start:3343 stop:3528 length:186 start_codon:yes stop_codon:yes gene_type:complete
MLFSLVNQFVESGISDRGGRTHLRAKTPAKTTTRLIQKSNGFVLRPEGYGDFSAKMSAITD